MLELPEDCRSVALPTLLALELRLRREVGEEPSATEYCLLFPEASFLIDALFKEMGLPGRTETASGEDAASEQKTGLWHPSNEPADLRPTVVKGRSNTSESGEAADAPGAVPLPLVPGYEIIEPIGHGGMGIVYKARQDGLDRLVALKMIRPERGLPLDGTRREYFFAEARAVARFQHPNLVQIHEVGEFNGQPYFSLELIDGGNLSQKLAGTPRSAGEAAALVETLARAVEYAHRKDIIHRDLKPANILLTGDGTPKIADFGLAKQMDRSPTEERGILGTPSYMAPEQARGANSEVGPAADIWALGAILYECLTGRPPFKAATKWRTIEQVLNQDLVPPSLLVPQVPGDLELICVRCLHKDASRRFATAAELADELRRFQEGRPIKTRPAPWWEVAWKWCRRQPTAASLIAVSVLLLMSLVLYLDQRARGAQRELREEQHHGEMRGRVQNLHLLAQEAAAQGRLPDALGHLQAALEIIRATPVLDDLEKPLLALHAELTRREVARKARLQAQASHQEFFQLRDKALFRGMVFEGVDLPASVAATKEACREALALFNMADRQGDLPALPELLTADEKHQCTVACYELLLVWADAVAQREPGRRDVARSSGEEALRLLDRAARLGLPPMKAYHLRRATYLDLVGDAESARRERQLAGRTRPSGSLDHFLSGSILQKQGLPAEAAAEFADALRAEPGHFWARYFLGVCNLQLDSPAQARDNFTACLAARNKFIWLYLLRGFAHGQMKAFQAAEDDYRRALEVLELEPDPQARYGILVNRGYLCLRQALLTDHPIVSPLPVPFVPNLLLACQGAADAYRKERLAASAALLEQAARLRPEQHVAHRYLAQVYHGQKRLDEAVEHLNRALEAAEQGSAPVRSQLYGQRARLYREQGKLDAALDDLARALELAPGSRDHAERGRILHLCQRYREAVTAYDDAIRLRPEAVLFGQKAQALLALRRDEEAANALSQYLARGGLPTEEVYRTRGVIRARLRQLPLALADYTQALDLRRTSATHAARAWVYLASEIHTLAQQDFEAAIELDDENGEAYAGRGLIRVRQGQPIQALADAERARVRGRPPTWLLLWNIAHVHAQLARYLDDRPKERNVRIGLMPGRCRERAIELLQEALAQWPEKDRPEFWKRYIVADELLDPLRGRPAFAELGRKYGR